ncbi:hypothetical protein [Methanogenium cariaci]|uniref:hypothetical protein n=1 Tax=Methanogenium cariaci TaxID=2197 RepID=UPI001FE1F0F5|nr:hypothetical protein [Methanogenium cariaci]
MAGAYYSARLAVLDYLRTTGRSGRAIVIRSVAGSYWAPPWHLGDPGGSTPGDGTASRGL